jgi:dolichyl-phosphate-mannose--protein O-mannosyl transferase
MAYIYTYTKSLTRLTPEGIESYPWQWLLNQVEIPYLKVDVNVYSNETIIKTFTSIHFSGAMNPAIIYLCIPAIVYSAYSFYEKKEDITLFSIIWFTATYLPFYPMALILHRIMYIFYFLNTVPSVCIAIAYLFLDQKPPLIVILIYSIAVILGFAFLFPFKTIP